MDKPQILTHSLKCTRKQFLSLPMWARRNILEAATDKFMQTEKVKSCWLSKQSKKGWSLGFALNKKTHWLTGLYFASEKDVKNAIKNNIVFVHLKKP